MAHQRIVGERENSTQDPLRLTLPGGYVVDQVSRQLLDARGAAVPLTPRPLAVLLHLAAHVGQLVTKEALVHAAWPGLVVTDDSLVQCIKLIRRGLGDESHEVLRTEPRLGYRLMPVPAPSPQALEALPVPRPQRRIAFAVAGDGARLAWCVGGTDGAPVVRVGAFAGHVEQMWHPPCGLRFLRLAERNRLLVYDPRGVGLSDPVNQWSLDQQVRDLEAVVDAAGWPCFALWANALSGAQVAIRFAGRHPNRVSHVVFENGVLRGKQRLAARPMSSETVEAYASVIERTWHDERSVARQMVASMVFGEASPAWREAYDRLLRVSMTGRAAALYWRAGETLDLSQEAAALRCPALVLLSLRYDPPYVEETRHLAALVPGARLECLDCANAVATAEEPAFEPTLRAIEEFLRPPAQVHRMVTSRSAPRAALAAVQGEADRARSRKSKAG